jgi:hypothetical protein
MQTLGFFSDFPEIGNDPRCGGSAAPGVTASDVNLLASGGARMVPPVSSDYRGAEREVRLLQPVDGGKLHSRVLDLNFKIRPFPPAPLAPEKRETDDVVSFEILYRYIEDIGT